jgi:uncharacterized membrane protein YuzA (DUF378 family)
MHNKTVHLVAFLLVIVGGLNWLLVGAFDIDLVMQLLGATMAAKAVYILIGLAAVYELVGHKGRCNDCKS